MHNHELFTVKRIRNEIYAWIFISIVLSFISHVSSWILVPVVLGGVIVIIGLLLSSLLNIKTETVTEYGMYSFGLGLAYMLLGGLVINTVLPFVGINQPLAKVPLLVFFFGSIIALLQYAMSQNTVFEIETYPVLSHTKDIVFGLVPVLFVLMSVIGSTVLNNGGTGLVPALMLVGVVVYVLSLFTWGKDVEEWVYVSALYCISLSLLLMYSLRSFHILGWDIHQEYQVFQTTLQNLRWSMSAFPSLDYNACLSITILPTIFAVLTKVSSEYVFKIIFQFVFAILPVITYLISRNYISKSLSFLASFLLLSQTWFYEQMPALIRQEVAFIFYSLLLLVLLNKKQSKLTNSILFYVFTSSLVLSHYSTAYIWITLFVGGFFLTIIFRYFDSRLKDQKMQFAPTLLIVSVLLVFVWQVSITQTGTAIKNLSKKESTTIFSTSTSEIATEVSNANVSKGTISPVQQVISKMLFISVSKNNQNNLNIAEQKAAKERKKGPGFYFDTKESDAVYIQDNTNILVTDVPEFVAIFITFISRAIKILVINILPIIGMIGILFFLRKDGKIKNYNILFINIGAYALLIMMLFMPVLQQYYNFSRLYLQMYITLCIFAIIGGGVVLKKYTQDATLYLMVIVILAFGTFSGLSEYFFGGQTRLTLHQTPSTLDTFYVYDSEVASARWLSLQDKRGVPIQADVLANLRLQSYSNAKIDNLNIFPRTILLPSYVYLSSKNTKEGMAYYQFSNELITYKYPIEFLENNKSLVYNNGNSKVFK